MGKLEKILEDQSHYWLQRASLEAEDLDLPLSKIYIEKALSMQPKDSLIITTKGYIDIKLGVANIADSKYKTEAEIAFRELKSLIENGKDRDAHAFHIIGSQGLAWSRKINYSSELERKIWLQDINNYIGKGRKKYPQNTDLKQLSDDVTKEILMMTTIRNPI